MKDIFIKDLKQIKENEEFEASFMILKRLASDSETITAFIGDNTGDIKAIIRKNEKDIKVGDVLKLKAVKEQVLKVSDYGKLSEFDLNDFLPSVKRPIDDIIKELEEITLAEIKSEEAKALNDYFFKDPDIMKKFRDGIGGLSQHHNYRGGLAEHTLNVTYIARELALRYESRYKEIAVLGAKLHDIGKIIEYDTDGPFSVTMRGDMEGHIVIGITMLEEAFRIGGDKYSEDFKNRIKSCIVQHHGKLEYGSPKTPSTEEAYIVHFADNIDAVLNKISQIKDITEPYSWSEYDRRIGTRLYL